jgi:hypothetical protein
LLLRQGLAALKQTVAKVNDALAARAEANLGAVVLARLLDLPPERTFGAEEFLAAQAAWVKKQAAALAIRWPACSACVAVHACIRECCTFPRAAHADTCCE